VGARKHGYWAVTLLFLLCALLPRPSACARAETVSVTPVETVIGENYVRYPQLEGMEDTAVQQAINDAVVVQANIAQRLVTLAVLADGATLTADYEAYLGGGVFSTVIDANGVMENGRNGQNYTALAFDLTDGRRLTVSDLFADPDAAAAHMEATLEATYLDELSDYLVYAELTPLPVNNFSLDADGVTFYYPASQFSLLSGYCGAAQFNYDELAEDLLPDANALPARLNALPETLADAEIRAKVEAAAAAGELPHVRAKIGDGMAELVSRYRLLRTPDQYPGGRYFQLEAPMFRQVLVLSDALTSGYQNSVAEGLMSFRADLYGLKTGVTARERWLQVLGEPETTVAFGEDLAYDYGLPVGTADYYTFGKNQLMMYADESGILYAVRLTD
jgi:hypothetical protein